MNGCVARAWKTPPPRPGCLRSRAEAFPGSVSRAPAPEALPDHWDDVGNMAPRFRPDCIGSRISCDGHGHANGLDWGLIRRSIASPGHETRSRRSSPNPRDLAPASRSGPTAAGSRPSAFGPGSRRVDVTSATTASSAKRTPQPAKPASWILSGLRSGDHSRPSGRSPSMFHKDRCSSTYRVAWPQQRTAAWWRRWSSMKVAMKK